MAATKAAPRDPNFATVAAVETAKKQLSRDFQYRSIFDFFNSIAAKQPFIS
jgi:hypothetical protein